MPEPYFLTVPEASKLLRLHQMTVYRMCKKRQIPRIRVGGSWRIPSDVVERMMCGEKATNDRN